MPEDVRAKQDLIAQLLGTAFPYSQFGPAGLAGGEGPVPPYDFQNTPAMQGLRALAQTGMRPKPPGQGPGMVEQGLGMAFPYSQFGPAGPAGPQGPVQPYNFQQTPVGQMVYQGMGMANQGITDAEQALRGGVGVANQGLYGALDLAGQAEQGIGQGVQAVEQGFEQGVQALDQGLAQGVQAVGQGVQGFGQGVAQGVGQVGQDLSRDADTVLDAVARLTPDPTKLDPLAPDSYARQAIGGLNQIPQAIASGGAGAIQHVIEGAQRFDEPMTPMIGPALRGIGPGISSAVGAVPDIISGILGAGSDAANYIMNPATRGGAEPPRPEGQTPGATGAWEPGAPAAPAEPVKTAEDEFNDLIKQILAGDAPENSARAFSVGVSASGGSGPGQPQPPVQGPQEQSAADKTMEAINEKLEKLATKSVLPPETFKDRLTKMLVGIAVGYSNAYAQDPSNFGRAGNLGLAGGIQNLAASDAQREKDQMDLDKQYQEGLTNSVNFQGQLYRTQKESEAAKNRDALHAQDIAQRREEAIMNVNSRLAAAQIRAQSSNTVSGRLASVRELLNITKLRREMERDNAVTPYDEEEVNFGTGSVKIGQLAGHQKIQAIAAKKSATLDTKTYSEFYNQVMADSLDKVTQMKQTFGDKAAQEWFEGEVTRRIMMFYDSNPERMRMALERNVPGGSREELPPVSFGE